MKKKLLSIFSNRKIIAAIIACMSTTVVISSCTKSSSDGTNYATQFVGSWTGTSSCGGTTTFVLSAGSSNNTLTSAGSVGSGSCMKSITVTGTASASGFTFSPQSFTDNCGNSYTVAEVATLSGGTLTLTETISGAISASCTFTGTK